MLCDVAKIVQRLYNMVRGCYKVTVVYISCYHVISRYLLVCIVHLNLQTDTEPHENNFIFNFNTINTKKLVCIEKTF